MPCSRCGATPETGQSEGCPECEGVVGPLRESPAAYTLRLRWERLKLAVSETWLRLRGVEMELAPQDMTITEHLEWDYKNAQVPDE
jgi:hypothetical protein